MSETEFESEGEAIMQTQDNNERTFKQLSQLQHLKERPGMYIGSTDLQELEIYILNETKTKINYEKTTFSPALLKLFDEIISNCVDHHIKNPRTVKNVKINFTE